MKIRAWLPVLLLTAGLIAGVGFLASRPVPDLPAFDGQVAFDPSQAMHYLSELVTRFPERDYMSPQRLQAAEWIAAELRKTGLQVHTQDFSEVIAGKHVDGLRNVYAVLPGERPEAILVLGHYDIPPYVKQGAGDDASGVITTMELARVFAKGPKPRWTMIFMATDSEEYGAMWGSYNFLQKSGWGDRLAAVVTLDYANMGVMKGIKVRSMGIQQGYAPLWLRQMALNAAGHESQAVDVAPAMEWVERSVLIAPTEHGAFLQNGIPAVDLGGVPENPAWQASNYHTPGDSLEKILPDTIGRYGRATERLLRGIQQLETIPVGEMVYFKMGSRYLPGWAVKLIQLLALLPLAGAVFVAWRRTAAGHMGDAFKEILHVAAVFAAGALGYLALWASSENDLMVRFELYPATQKDPVLNHPELLPVALTLGAIVLGYLGLRWMLQIRRGGDPSARQAVILSGLLGLMVTCVFFNAGFAALALLAPTILLWTLVRPASSTWRRIFNGVAALSAASVFLIFIMLFGKLYYIGNIAWYLMMCAAYGLFRARAIFSFLAAAAIVIRFVPAAVALRPAFRPATHKGDRAVAPQSMLWHCF